MKNPGLVSSFYGLATLVLVSGLAVNPWAGRFYRAQSVNYEDVMAGYFQWSLCVAALLACCGWWLARKRTEERINLCLLVATISLVALADRMVLAWVGLPYWIVDERIHYRHRPGVTRTWLTGNPSTASDLGFSDKLIRINRYGHHDDNFPMGKPAGEFRGLMIGDSIVMGHGVTKDEAFAGRLENLLRAHGSGHASYQMINTGVQGYATSQELYILEESLVFDPDFIVIGFAVNDVTRPFHGSDRSTTAPHLMIRNLAGIVHASPLWRYALNETGFGRLVQMRRQDVFRRAGQSWTLEVHQLSRADRDDPDFRNGWNIVLADLEQMYALARQRGIPIVLVIFPETHQLYGAGRQQPQRILTEHARVQGVDCLDLAGHVEKWLQWDLNTLVARAGRPQPDRSLYGSLYQLLANFYFMDPLHLTPEGHERVAAVLAHYLADRGLVEVDHDALAAHVLKIRERGVADSGRVLNVIVPSQSEALLEQGVALHALGRYRTAVRVYEKGLEQFPQISIQTRLYRGIGDAQADQGRDVEAQMAYDRAIGLAQRLADDTTDGAADDAIRHYMGLLYLSAGRLKEAVASFERDGSAGLYTRLGADLLSSGRLRAASNAYRTALAMDTTDRVARINLGWTLYVLGDLDRAIVEYRRVLAVGPEITAQCNLALAQLARGDVAAARAEYLSAIAHFGADQIRQIGAVDDLRDLAVRGVEADAARKILQTHW